MRTSVSLIHYVDPELNWPDRRTEAWYYMMRWWRFVGWLHIHAYRSCVHPGEI